MASGVVVADRDGRITIPTEKQRFAQVCDLCLSTRLSFADACRAVLAMEFDPPHVISFDRGFDRVAGLRRVEP